MGTFEEEYEYKKGFERGFEGKSKSESVAELVFGVVQTMFGFEKEVRESRVKGYKAGVSERRRRKYYAGETVVSTVKDMFGFDERNVDRGSGFAAARKQKQS